MPVCDQRTRIDAVPVCKHLFSVCVPISTHVGTQTNVPTERSVLSCVVGRSLCDMNLLVM